MAPRRSIAVIGAGPAGLAAAWRLSAAGHAVTLYEERQEPGGRLRTDAFSDTAADAAVQLLSGGYARLRAMVEDLGAAHLLVPTPGRDALWRNGRIHAVRYGSVPSMATSGALPAGLKLRMGLKYVHFLERHGHLLDLNEPARAAAGGLDDESIAEWGHREMGRDFVELLAYPLLASYYGVTPEETSAAFFHALARTGMSVDVMGVRGGVGTLSAALWDALRRRGVEARLGVRVTALTRESAGFVRLQTARGGGSPDPGPVRHDAAVVAVPPSRVPELLPDVSLPPVRARPTAALLLAVNGTLETAWFGLSLPRSELRDSALAAVCVQSEKATGVATGRPSLVLIPAPHRAEAWAGLPPREVVDEALPILEEVLPGVGGRVAAARLVRLAGGVVPYPGYLRALSEWDVAALPEGVALAGDYLVAPTVEGAVRSGEAAADRVSRPGA